jgi:hypothetical protein
MSKLKEILETIKENVSLEKVVGDIGKTLSHHVEMGAHELASAIFRGEAFVMYPEAGKELHGPTQDVNKEMDGPSM